MPVKASRAKPPSPRGCACIVHACCSSLMCGLAQGPLALHLRSSLTPRASTDSSRAANAACTADSAAERALAAAAAARRHSPRSPALHLRSSL
eukprot:CAMPEP_0202100412 /NCGR_PEP_ID=MMETSP0965-20130614/3128_1 /ASSEMBLY_ACC=CAM_ASM_000507 /TAXON_ID=4773 /ORGANISM="Schizochytrium aggregatum, Strain ATCC28209" /LENGTH=92 /DNA_ID=CAMNT_0048669067 /DNA_START=446 /DNA_END=721 /DNA_ORIENTATION=+